MQFARNFNLDSTLVTWDWLARSSSISNQNHLNFKKRMTINNKSYSIKSIGNQSLFHYIANTNRVVGTRSPDNLEWCMPCQEFKPRIHPNCRELANQRLRREIQQYLFPELFPPRRFPPRQDLYAKYLPLE